MTAKKEGTTPRDWKTPFLLKLADSGNVSRACRTAKISRQHAYRARQADLVFRAAWDEAVTIATGLLEDEAWRRAREGVLEPVFFGGKKTGAVRRYSDTLLIFLLKAHKPEMYRETVNQAHSGEIQHAVTITYVNDWRGAGDGDGDAASHD